MTRAELAEGVNDYLWRTAGKRYALDAHAIARYERGKVRWPSPAYRAGLKAILKVASDADLGFRSDRRGAQGRRAVTQVGREFTRGASNSAGGRSWVSCADGVVGLEEKIAEIRSVVAAFDAPDDGPVRSIKELRHEVSEVVQLRVHSCYSRLMNRVPRLIPELTRVLMAGDEGQRTSAAGLLVQVYRAADAAVNKRGFYDLSSRIIQVMTWVAAHTDDGATRAAVSYVRGEEFFSTRDYAAGVRVLERAANELSPRSEREMAAYGALCMRTAVLHARGGDAQRAHERLAEAYEVAGHVSERVHTGTAFGSGSVRIHDVTLALEFGDPVRALALAAGWSPPPQIPAERASHFHIDVARAQLQARKPEGVIGSLRAAHQVAPEHTRTHPYVEALVDQMVTAGGQHEAAARAFVEQAGVSAGQARGVR